MNQIIRRIYKNKTITYDTITYDLFKRKHQWLSILDYYLAIKIEIIYEIVKMVQQDEKFTNSYMLKTYLPAR